MTLTKAQRAKLDAQLSKWQQDLVNLTKRNRLLYFRHTKTSSLEVVSPAMSTIFNGLSSNGWRMYVPPQLDESSEEDDEDNGGFGRAAGGPGYLTTSKKNGKDVLKALRSLERSSNQTMLDTGLWTLYLAFGMLRWTDPSDGAEKESPLLLQPVALQRDGLPDDFTLVATEDDVVFNPALTIKMLNDFGIQLPSIDEVDATPTWVVEQVRRAIKDQKGWSVDERTALASFSFHKEAMYRDLIANAALIADHPLVQLAAVGAEAGSDAFSFEPASDDVLDELAAPEDLVSIRDADSTQRKCIIAARDGRSFVMDGPPGTGKSQTITNIIAELIHAGKRVLFVSEKAAALEVVHNRLEEAGLSEFVLSLHSHKATRKEVATELGRSLETKPVARSSFSETDRASLIKARKELSGYATALNVRREPLGQSLHQALGSVLQLQNLPQAPVAASVDADLTPEEFDQIQDAARRLGRSWGPVERGDRFLWRSLRDLTISAGRQQRVYEILTACANDTEALRALLEELTDTVGIQVTMSLDGAARLQAALARVESKANRATLPIPWFSGVDLGPLRSLLDERQSAVRAYEASVEHARQIAGVAVAAIPLGRSELLYSQISELSRLGIVVDAEADRPWLRGAITTIQDAHERITDILNDAHIVARTFSLGQPVTISRCAELVELSSFIGSATPPEAAWLNPVVQTALGEAESVLTTLVTDYRARREVLSKVFTDGVLDLPLVELHARLSDAGAMKKLGGRYRADKKTLAPCVLTGKVTTAVVNKLPEAIAWAELRRKLQVAENVHGGLLGSYWSGPVDTDLPRAERALNLARRAIEITAGTGSTELATQLAPGGSPDPLTLQTGQRLAERLTSWTNFAPGVEALCTGAPPAELPQLLDWLSKVLSLLRSCQLGVDEYEAAVGTSTTVTRTIGALHHADEAARHKDAVDSRLAADVDALGPSYLGVDTDFEQFREDLTWAELTVDLFETPLAPRVVERLLLMSPMASTVEARLESARKRWAEVADIFEQPWRGQLDADFAMSLDDGLSLLEELTATVGDLDEWCRFAAARQELLDAGLGPAVTFVESQGVKADDVPGVLKRSVLERWCDVVMADDPRLKTLAPSERNAVVDRFRVLDEALVANASARVVNTCAARRPSTSLGAAGIIRREAQKKTRHKAIRQLLSETRDAVLALKPCFMMSPLSVSQYLPSDLTFDVVIFDEASQVRPGDAINCIYRGRQLIVAGDPRQLPPTNFFESTIDESAEEYDDEAPEDFESVLDIFLGSGLPPLSLQWHYRSQHESLITFSNYRFYDGKLHTFPGAVEVADDVGIELIDAEGIYRRGGARDNPIEAAKVVERVLFHRRNHPDLTLGVVAFSSAQESAIVAEMERLARTEPELPELMSTDRLHGFFVKNLENVQGDERDIIIFSIGYGRDENGKFTEQLGPLGKQGGERRLNVAVTRARRRVEVVSSVRAGDFPGTSAARGIRELQKYLEFAERGITALALDMEASGGDAESPFEEAVLGYIRSLGYDVVPQVGVAGFRLDMAIRHPDRPGSFMLGIECDGAAYHSSRVARDRDRLRQEILEGLGWRIHRIWGPSWYHDRAGQEQVLRTAIESCLTPSKPSRAKKQAPPTPVIEVQAAHLDMRPDWAVTYVASEWRRPSFNELQSVDRATLTDAVERIVGDESPVHEDLVRRRIMDAYYVKRMGSRVREVLDGAIAAAVRRRSVTRIDGEFLTVPGSTVKVRVPRQGSDDIRKVNHIAPFERQEALRQLVVDSHRVSQDDLRVAYARLFGWKRAGAEIEAAFEADLATLARSGEVRVDDSQHVQPG